MPTKTEKRLHYFPSLDSLHKHSTLFYLNFYPGGFRKNPEPFRVHYQLLLISWNKWAGKDLEEFCNRETLSYFLFNAKHDSPANREAYFNEIKEFISGL